jgi:monoamine oxidase
MAQALDNVPQTDAEREEAERLLTELSAGKSIPKVRTGTLPPLSLTISGPSAPVVPRPVIAPRKPSTQSAAAPKRRRKKKKNKMMVPALAMFVLLAGGAAYTWYSGQQQEKAQQAAAARAAEARKGLIRIAGLPDGVRATISGTPYKTGDSLVVNPGTYEAQIQGPGFQSNFVNIQVDSGQVIDRDFKPDLIPTDVATLPGNTPAVQQQTTTRPGGNQQLAQASKDSGEVRITVTPSFAEIWHNNTRIGAGRKVLRTTVGNTEIRFTAVGCQTKTEPVTVKVAEPQVVNVQLSCSGGQ